MTLFTSDNISGIHPDIAKAIDAANSGYGLPYGHDDISAKLNDVYSKFFDRQVFVVPCLTGTAANALALSLIAGPINSVGVHHNSHIQLDECNAPEFYTGGAKLLPLSGENGKIDPSSIEREFATIGQLHSPQLSAISISQITETGTIYSTEDIEAISSLIKPRNIKLHMDGARVTNAFVALNKSPADVTWKAGVDILSFGATKSGCLAGEALVLFDETHFEEARYRLKRSGQLISKQRFLAAQLIAFIEDGVWEQSAGHSHQMMSLLCQKLEAISGVEIPAYPESNMVYVRFSRDQIKRLQAAKIDGYIYETGLMRLCTSWATSEADIRKFEAVVSG